MCWFKDDEIKSVVYHTFISSPLHQHLHNGTSVINSRHVPFANGRVKMIHCTFANPTSCCPFQVRCTADDNIRVVTAVALITNVPDHRTLVSNGAVVLWHESRLVQGDTDQLKNTGETYY